MYVCTATATADYRCSYTDALKATEHPAGSVSRLKALNERTLRGGRARALCLGAFATHTFSPVTPIRLTLARVFSLSIRARQTRCFAAVFWAIFGGFQLFSVNPMDFNDSDDDFSHEILCFHFFPVAISSAKFVWAFKFMHLHRDVSKAKKP